MLHQLKKADTVLLRNISEKFDVKEYKVAQFLMRHGKIICKVLVNSDCIEREYYNCILDTDDYFLSLVIPNEVVLNNASESVPFDNKPRVYFLLDEHVVVYVGQSRQIHNRINDHLNDKCFNRVATLEIPERELFMTENMNILHYNPCFNHIKMSPYHYFKELVRRTEYPE